MFSIIYISSLGTTKLCRNQLQFLNCSQSINNITTFKTLFALCSWLKNGYSPPLWKIRCSWAWTRKNRLVFAIAVSHWWLSMLWVTIQLLTVSQAMLSFEILSRSLKVIRLGFSTKLPFKMNWSEMNGASIYTTICIQIIINCRMHKIVLCESISSIQDRTWLINNS
jgi:hypothetical protein